MSESEELSSGEPISSTRVPSSDSLHTGSSRSHLFEDELFSMETLSYFCLCSCAGWALYNCNHRICVFLYVSSVIILCYGLMGALRDRSRHIENLFGSFRVLASTIPISSLNAHLYICDSGCSKFNVLVVLIAIPLILKVIYPDRDQRIIDIVVWSNVHTIGLKAVQHFSLLALITSLWQTFYFLVTQNSTKWLQTTPEIPFNLGLSGMCWCIFAINFCHGMK